MKDDIYLIKRKLLIIKLARKMPITDIIYSVFKLENISENVKEVTIEGKS